MRVIFSLLIAAMIFAVSSHAKAAPNEPVYVATYIETQPQAAEQGDRRAQGRGRGGTGGDRQRRGAIAARDRP